VTNELFRRACAYPFDLPARSCVYVNGRLFGLRSFAPEEPCRSEVTLDDRQVQLGDLITMMGVEAPHDVTDRRLVLGYASNASLTALRRKFGATGRDEVIPVVASRLHGLDVVYSAHISRYGSIPATLQASRDTVVRVHGLLLSPQQLQVLHATEPNYHLARLGDVDVQTEFGESHSEVEAYVSRHGCLRLGDGEAALEAIPAEHRHFPELSQPNVIEAVRDKLGLRGSVEDFTRENVKDPELAKRRTAALRADAASFAWHDVKRLTD
jgi:hypothetical protein